MSVDWQTGWIDYRGGFVAFFEDSGVVWYDASKGIARDGWQKALEPFEGPGHVGLPFPTKIIPPSSRAWIETFSPGAATPE